MTVSYIRIDADILMREDLSDKAKLLLGLVRSFNSHGLMMSNPELGKLLCAHPNHITRLLDEVRPFVRIENPQSQYRRVFYLNAGVEVHASPVQRPGLSESSPLQHSGVPLKHFGASTQTQALDITKETEKKTTLPQTAVAVWGVDARLEKVRARFASTRIFEQFRIRCGGDTKLMQRYLDYADSQPNIERPVGLAVSLAERYGLDGLPAAEGGKDEKQCAFCEKSSVKWATIQGRKSNLCPDHLSHFRMLKEMRVVVTNALMRTPAVSHPEACSQVVQEPVRMEF
jgi:hypothetical protein